MANRGSTIRDVAKYAGVSISTVSKAFNNTGSLSDETRRRVLAAATQLHFSPNALIRSLRQGRANAIGVFTWDLLDDLTRDITMSLFRGITQGITGARYDMVTYAHMPERTPAVMASVFLDGRIDGVIVRPNDVDEAGMAALAAAGFPTVGLYRSHSPHEIGVVAIDNAGGVARAVEYLVALGHRRIAFYAPFFTFDFAERAASYLDTLERLRIPADPELCFLDETATRRHYLTLPEAACEQVLNLCPHPPTALIAGDDTQALLWIEALRQRGLRVPEDMSVIGFDDVPAAETAGLSTIRQPALEVGRTAANFVKAMIDGIPPAECRTVLPVEPVWRATTAPPRTV